MNYLVKRGLIGLVLVFVAIGVVSIVFIVTRFNEDHLNSAVQHARDLIALREEFDRRLDEIGIDLKPLVDFSHARDGIIETPCVVFHPRNPENAPRGYQVNVGITTLGLSKKGTFQMARRFLRDREELDEQYSNPHFRIQQTYKGPDRSIPPFLSIMVLSKPTNLERATVEDAGNEAVIPLQSLRSAVFFSEVSRKEVGHYVEQKFKDLQLPDFARIHAYESSISICVISIPTRKIQAVATVSGKPVDRITERTPLKDQNGENVAWSEAYGWLNKRYKPPPFSDPDYRRDDYKLDAVWKRW